MQYYYPNPNNRPLQPPDSHPNPPYTPGRRSRPVVRRQAGGCSDLSQLWSPARCSAVCWGDLGRTYLEPLSERLTENS